MIDHEQLRLDPIFNVVLGKNPEDILAGKSTLNRLEYKSTEIESEKSRYHKIKPIPEKIAELIVELFLESYGKEPRQIVIDLDVTDIRVHGEQDGAFYNSYYHGICYAPLYLFCGYHILSAKLRPSNVDSAGGGLEEISRIVNLIRNKWKNTIIIIRGDRAYARDEIMNWCESQEKVEYIIGMPSNERLIRESSDLVRKVTENYHQKAQPVTEFLEQYFEEGEYEKEVKELIGESKYYRTMYYKTHESWSRQRRIVTKIAYDGEKVNQRFIVTSLTAEQIPPQKLYTKKYCLRGEMENRIKEQQLDLFSDRASVHNFEGNQLRLWYSAIAYILMQSLRQYGLKDTELEKAQIGTIRLKFLKLGARVISNAQKIIIAISSSNPIQELFKRAYSRLEKVPAPS